MRRNTIAGTKSVIMHTVKNTLTIYPKYFGHLVSILQHVDMSRTTGGVANIVDMDQTWNQVPHYLLRPVYLKT